MKRLLVLTWTLVLSTEILVALRFLSAIIRDELSQAISKPLPLVSLLLPSSPHRHYHGNSNDSLATTTHSPPDQVD